MISFRKLDHPNLSSLRKITSLMNVDFHSASSPTVVFRHLFIQIPFLINHSKTFSFILITVKRLSYQISFVTSSLLPLLAHAPAPSTCCALSVILVVVISGNCSHTNTHSAQSGNSLQRLWSPRWSMALLLCSYQAVCVCVCVELNS